jgi:hypothetical protein
MTQPDLTAEEAQDVAWKTLGAILVEEDGVFIVYKMVTAGDAPGPASRTTLPMKRVEVARGATRREALAKAGAP